MHRPHGLWELLHPDELEDIVASAPIAYVPLGSFEHHGWHLPVCFDGIKAHAICARACCRTGGVVLPTMFYATGGGHTNYKWTMMERPEHIGPLLRTTLGRLAVFGFRVVAVLTGHYPGEQTTMVQDLAREAALEHPGTRFLALSDPDLTTPVPGDKFAGDHAAMYETSIAMELSRDWVCMARLTAGRDPDPVAGGQSHRQGEPAYDPNHPLYAIWGKDPRKHASPELGARLVGEVVSRLTELVETALRGTAPHAAPQDAR